MKVAEGAKRATAPRERPGDGWPVLGRVPLTEGGNPAVSNRDQVVGNDSLAVEAGASHPGRFEEVVFHEGLEAGARGDLDDRLLAVHLLKVARLVVVFHQSRAHGDHLVDRDRRLVRRDAFES